MKIFMILILLAISACSKEEIQPQNSVTSYALTYDLKWNLLDKRVSFHWHDLDEITLQRFRDKKNDTLCTLSGNTVLTYKVLTDTCQQWRDLP